MMEVVTIIFSSSLLRLDNNAACIDKSDGDQLTTCQTVSSDDASV